MVNLLTPTYFARGLEQYNPSPVGCVLYLPFWHPYLKGTIFNSADSFRHLATVTGATWGATGRTFNGTDENIDLGNKSVLDFLRTGLFSGICWLKRAATGGSGSFIMGKRLDTGDTPGWNIQFRGNNTFSFLLVATVSPVNYIFTATDTTIADTTIWYQCAFTYDGSSAAAGVVFYINGVVEAATAITDDLTGTTTSSASFALGMRNVVDTNIPFNGVIGEAAVYNRVLTAAEILRHYQATRWKYP